MKRALLWIASSVLALTLAAGYYVARFQAGWLASMLVLIGFALLMIPYFALGFDQVVDALRDVGRSSRLRLTLIGLLLTIPGLFVVAGGGGRVSLRHIGALAVYVALPIGILATFGRTGSSASAVDLAVILLLWLPVEMQYFEAFWRVPAGNPSYVLAKTLGMELGIFCFVVVRRLDGVGYRFRVAGEDFIVGAIALVAFLILAVPTALGIGFVEFDPRWDGLGRWIMMSLGIFFFIALPEEVLFRGLIFNLLQRLIKTGGPYSALVISSLIFGLAHLNNPPGDWRYVVLATCAGLFYGWAYLRTGSLMASSYAHALVDIIGRTMFPHDSR